MNLKEQHYILAIAKYANITKAAQTLNLSQPALSIFLNHTEDELGVKLFERTNKKMILTPSGELYVRKATKMVALQKEFERELSLLHHQREITLSMGIPFIMSDQLIPKIRQAVSGQYPHVEMIFEENIGDLLYGFLKRGKCDFILCSQQDAPEYTHLPISEDKLLLALDKDNPIYAALLESNAPYAPLDLLQEELLLLNKDSHSIGKFVRNKLKELGFTPRKIEQFDKIDTTMKLITPHSGISIVNERYLNYMKIPANVRFYPLQDDFSRTFSLTQMKSRATKDPQLQEFLSYLASVIQDIDAQSP